MNKEYVIKDGEVSAEKIKDAITESAVMGRSVSIKSIPDSTKYMIVISGGPFGTMRIEMSASMLSEIDALDPNLLAWLKDVNRFRCMQTKD